jgi:hypothetical protein
MDLSPWLKSLEDTGLASHIRHSLYLFPFLEAVHVMALAVVFGTVTIVDLRLLGLASTNRPFQRVADELLRWTWAGFAMSVITGATMFTTNARVYANNTAFRIKLVLLALAGLNMLMFHLTAGRTAAQWEKRGSAPASGKTAAALSIVLWIAIIFAGRVIGFTTTGMQAKESAPAPSVNFDDFLGGATTPGAATPGASAPGASAPGSSDSSTPPPN